MSTRTRRDWILWAQLGCALVATAHAEYTLALAVDLNEYVALAVPGALDLYVIRALQKHKDVLPAVLVMVAANIASVLVHAGILPVQWAVYSAVGALAPLLVWRGHILRVHESAVTGAGSAPAPAAPETKPVQVTGSAPFSDHAPSCICDECNRVFGGILKRFEPGAPDHVPASWMDDEYPETHPSAPHPKPSAVPYPAPVPDLPDEYAAGAVHSETPLTAADWQYVDRADRYVRDTDKPSVRGLRRTINVGQDRAERLLTHLGVLL